jgi:hypothetical protein
LFGVITWKFSFHELEFPVRESNSGEERAPEKFQLVRQKDLSNGQEAEASQLGV